MQRRGFLKGMAAIGGCVACARLAIASNSSIRWSYEGDRGVAHWGDLSRGYQVCSTGTQQSPIDLGNAISAQLEPIKLDWKKSSGTMLNNGHTIQIDVAPGNMLTYGGKVYELQQFHFHAPSEHLIDGRSFPMELHFVHRLAATGELAVLAVFLAPGGEKGHYGAIANVFPNEEGRMIELQNIDLKALLPPNLDYLTYAGSLTTPPCSEIVTWLVAKTPLLVDEMDIKQFTLLYHNNARPIEPVNRRLILTPG